MTPDAPFKLNPSGEVQVIDLSHLYHTTRPHPMSSVPVVARLYHDSDANTAVIVIDMTALHCEGPDATT